MTKRAHKQNAKRLEDIFGSFKVVGNITNVFNGPVVTTYEFEPAPGIKSSKVIGLADDVARSMSAISCRMSVVPGRTVIGIELPNETRETVYLNKMLTDKTFTASSAKLPLALGKDINGRLVVADLAKAPHMLVAGTTGSGKSVAINTFIVSLLKRFSPSECRFVMIDPKMLELSIYNDIPHLMTPVVTDSTKAVYALYWAVHEMENRYQLMAGMNVRNISSYNQVAEPLPYIVIIIDEVADLMMVAGKEVEAAVQRLAQMARAAGIHLIMATQRPSVDVITGTIKANFPTRISFQVTTATDSRTILSEQGAEKLLGMGDMLFMSGGGKLQRVHGAFVSDEDVVKLVERLKAQGKPDYVDILDVMKPEEPEEVYDEYAEAVRVATIANNSSPAFIQRQLGIGYIHAKELSARMEREGALA